jgi:hypothetical protein
MNIELQILTFSVRGPSRSAIGAPLNAASRLDPCLRSPRRRTPCPVTVPEDVRPGNPIEQKPARSSNQVLRQKWGWPSHFPPHQTDDSRICVCGCDSTQGVDIGIRRLAAPPTQAAHHFPGFCRFEHRHASISLLRIRFPAERPVCARSRMKSREAGPLLARTRPEKAELGTSLASGVVRVASHGCGRCPRTEEGDLDDVRRCADFESWPSIMD